MAIGSSDPTAICWEAPNEGFRGEWLRRWNLYQAPPKTALIVGGPTDADYFAAGLVLMTAPALGDAGAVELVLKAAPLTVSPS
jgi:hypothetical protein